MVEDENKGGAGNRGPRTAEETSPMSGRLTRAPARAATEQDALGWLRWRFGATPIAAHRSLADQVETYLAGATDRRSRAILRGDQSLLTVDVLRRYAEGAGPLTTADARRACEIVATLADIAAAAETMLEDVEALIGSSEGVAGLHQNGDLAPWDTLLSGGAFEPWLRSLDDLRDRIAQTPPKPDALDSRIGHENEDPRQTFTAEELAALAEGQARSMGYEGHYDRVSELSIVGPCAVYVVKNGEEADAASLDRVAERLGLDPVTLPKEPLQGGETTAGPIAAATLYDEGGKVVATWPPALPTYTADQAKRAARIVSCWAGGPGGTASQRCENIGQVIVRVAEALGLDPTPVEQDADAARFAAIKP